ADLHEQGGRYEGDASGPPNVRGDAGNAEGNAGLFAASPHGTAPDLREHARGDAGTLGDAEMQPLSGPDVGPCVQCRKPTIRYGAHGNPRCPECRPKETPCPPPTPAAPRSPRPAPSSAPAPQATRTGCAPSSTPATPMNSSAWSSPPARSPSSSDSSPTVATSAPWTRT